MSIKNRAEALGLRRSNAYSSTAPPRRAGDLLGVAVEIAGLDPGLGTDPFGLSGVQHRLVHQYVDPAVGNVDGDDVPLLHKGDGTSQRGLGGDMADGSAAGGTGKASIGDEAPRPCPGPCPQGQRWD